VAFRAYCPEISGAKGQGEAIDETKEAPKKNSEWADVSLKREISALLHTRQFPTPIKIQTHSKLINYLCRF
jgi:superfamily II DNA/RNA helicase